MVDEGVRCEVCWRSPVKVIAGVDVSTLSIAVVVLNTRDGALVKFDEFFFPKKDKLPNKNPAERCRHIILDAYTAFMNGVSVMQVEQPMGSSIKSVAEVERVVGAVIRSTPYKTHVNPPIGPSEWKKLAGLAGNAKKPEIAVAAVRRFPLLADESQDIHDAALIAYALYAESVDA